MNRSSRPVISPLITSVALTFPEDDAAERLLATGGSGMAATEGLGAEGFSAASATAGIEGSATETATGVATLAFASRGEYGALDSSCFRHMGVSLWNFVVPQAGPGEDSRGNWGGECSTEHEGSETKTSQIRE